MASEIGPDKIRTATEVAQPADMSKYVSAEALPPQNHSNDPMHLAAVAGRALLHSAIGEPAAGATQLLNHATDAVGLGKVVSQPDWFKPTVNPTFGTAEWAAQTVGSGIGMAAPFLATEFVVGKGMKATGLAGVTENMGWAGKLVQPTLAGAAYGFVFTPTAEGGNFLEDRGISAAVGGATFMGQRAFTMGIMGGLAKTGVPLGESAFQSSVLGYGTRIGSNLVAGGLAGGLNAETSSLLHGKGLATKDELIQSAAAFALTGGVLDVAHIAGEKLSAARGVGPGGARNDGSTKSPVADVSATGMTDAALTNAAKPVGAKLDGAAPDTIPTVVGAREASAESAPKIGGKTSSTFGKTETEGTSDNKAGGGSGSMSEVQGRMEGKTVDSQAVRPTSPKIIEQSEALKQTVAESLSKLPTSGKVGDGLQSQHFDRLIANLTAREHDGVGTDAGELAKTLSAVNRLLKADNLVVDLSAQQRVGLAKQLLFEAGDPRYVGTGANNTHGASGVQTMMLYRMPGTMTDGIVTLLETGKFKTGSNTPVHVDLSADSLATLPPEFRSPLKPDLQAKESLISAGIAGLAPVGPNARSYASQLAQMLAVNVAKQSDPTNHQIYVKSSENGNSAGSGERVFQLENGRYKAAEQNGVPLENPKLTTPDLQFIYDQLSGTDNASLVLKNGRYSLVMDTQGMISGKGESRFGLYGDDTRFLSSWEIGLNGVAPELKRANIDQSYSGNFVYTNRAADGLPAGSVTLSRDVVINDGVSERLKVKNVTDTPVTFDLSVGFGSDFADMFEVRGWQRPKRGTLGEPVTDGGQGTVSLNYVGLDNSKLRTDIQTDSGGRNQTGDPKTTQATGTAGDGSVNGRSVNHKITLEPGAEHTIEFGIQPGTNREGPAEKLTPFEQQAKKADEAYAQWRDSTASIKTGNEQFNTLMERVYRDLYMLRQPTPGGDAIAAGIPWFAAAFGRDQLITGLQTVPFMPEMSKGVIEQLAAYQGTKEDPVTAEKPGKIMHELRLGEMARNKEIPFTPYYGTVDATPLWMTLLGKYVKWTGDTELAKQLKPNIDGVLAYLDAETAQTGYLRYGGKDLEALSNQGWKDSGDSIMHKDGTFVKGPITLPEAQGYLYSAWNEASSLLDAMGEHTRAAELKVKAEALKDRFNRDFWMPDQNYIALALDGKGNQAQVVSSNPGHLLMSGLLTPGHAFAVENRLLQTDMFTGFGIRTLSSGESRYDPTSYHNGTIWPHDNSMAVDGMHDLVPEKSDSQRVMLGLFDAALHQPQLRLPELFGGYPRNSFAEPVPYPVSCIPQAWAAGSMIQMLRANLGLHANAAKNELMIFKPSVPTRLGPVDITGLRVGSNTVDLRFTPGPKGTKTEVLSNPGNVKINLEKSATASSR